MHDMAEHPCAEEDDIRLLDLFTVLLNHKLFIIGIVCLAAAVSVIITYNMTNIYRSEAAIMPKSREERVQNPLSALTGLGGAMVEGLGLGGGGSLEKLEAVLKSRNLTDRVINKHNLMPIIFPDDWNEKEKKWKTDEPPTRQDGWEEITKKLLTVRVDVKKNTIQVAFDHPDPEAAKRIVDYYLTELSEALREEVLQDAAENMRFFKKQLEKTTDTLLQEKIYNLLAKEIEKETFARAQKYYSFQVLDPPVVPDRDKESKPRRVLICVLSVVVALFLAIFLAFLKEYFAGLKTLDPERYQRLQEGLKFGRRKAGKRED